MPENTETVNAHDIREGDVIYYGATKLRVNSVDRIRQHVHPGGTYRDVVYPNGLILQPAVVLATTLLYHPDTAALSAMNIGTNPDLVCDANDTFERVLPKRDPERTYAVGVVAVVTFDPDGGLQVEVDLSDLADDIPNVSDDDNLLRESYAREDAERVRRAVGQKAYRSVAI